MKNRTKDNGKEEVRTKEKIFRRACKEQKQKQQGYAQNSKNRLRKKKC